MNPSQARADNTWASAAGNWGGEFHPEFGPKRHRLECEQVDERTTFVESFNLPPQVSMSDFKIWSDVEPPKGTMHNYPIRPWHNSRPSLAVHPAPPDIAVQIFNRATIPTMWAKLHSGQSIPQVIARAKDEVHGFMR